MYYCCIDVRRIYLLFYIIVEVSVEQVCKEKESKKEGKLFKDSAQQ